LQSAFDNPNHVFPEAPFTRDIVKAMHEVSREDVPDMPDRIIAATPLFWNVTLISRDGRIQASNVRTVW
jgi:PIN domain nuclease of toxin-antitoxin system